MPTPSHTRGVTGQTVNYFWPLVKGAPFFIQKTGGCGFSRVAYLRMGNTTPAQQAQSQRATVAETSVVACGARLANRHV